jgi:hypothetical protein
VQGFRTQVPALVLQTKSVGQVWPAEPQAVGTQWWLAVQLSPSRHSVLEVHPGTQPMFVGQLQGTISQIFGAPASVAHCESELQGLVTARQAPPQTVCPGGLQNAPPWQSEAVQHPPLDVSCPASFGGPASCAPPLPVMPPFATPPVPDAPPVPAPVDPEQARSGNQSIPTSALRVSRLLSMLEVD